MGFTRTKSGTDDPDPVLNQIWCFALTDYCVLDLKHGSSRSRHKTIVRVLFEGTGLENILELISIWIYG